VEDYLSEKERWEWVRAQVRENAPAVILAVVVVLGSLAGWRWWQDRQDSARVAAGSRYMNMVEAIDRGDHAQAMRLLGELERDSAGSPYTDQAKMLAARIYVESGELDKAATELSTVVAQSKDHDLASVARLRLARVQVAQGKADAALATLGANDTTAFAGRSREIRGDAYLAKGGNAEALTEYRAAKAASAAMSNPLLDLKIADLSAGETAAATPAAAAPMATAAPAK
jgi:predicted negative regulator of RcsB-dependent stress response